MRVNEYIFLVLFMLCINLPDMVYGQCQEPEITVPAEGCIGESLGFSVDGPDMAVWDFCAGELAFTPDFERVVESSPSFGRARGIKVIGNESDGYFMFSVNNANNQLTILAFGNSLTNTPSNVQLLDISSHSPSAYDVDVVKHTNTYSVFIACSQTNSVTRLDFNNSLFNPPNINVLDVSFERQVNAITLLSDGSTFYGFVTQNDRISRLEFNNGIQDPNPARIDYDVPGARTLRKTAFQEYCGSWIGLTVSFELPYPFLIEFENGELAGDLSVSPLPNTGDDLRLATNLSFNWEGDTFYFHIMGGLGNLYFASLRADKSITALDFTDYGTLGISNANFPLEIVKEGPFWMGFSADHRARDLIRYRFNSLCDADQEIANGLEVRKAFSSAGTKTIVVETSLGNEVRKGAATIEINSSQAPPADFSYLASCVSTPVKYVFSENTDDLVSINWDFGDGTSGTGSSVEHSYASAGSYNVTAQIESQNGCTNQIKKEVFVYPDFNAGFSISNQISCTNAAIIFQNEIDEDLQDVVSHEWSIDGVPVSNDVDLTYMFDEAGTYTVQLVSSLNECSSIYSEIIEVLEGPAASFTVSDACVGTSFNFNNTSSGDISGYIWNFGDGTSSTLESPVYTYNSPGDYTVRLTAFNDAGCETFIEQLVTVYSEPIPEFGTGLACESNPVQFTDQSTVSNANIESWFWDFGNGNISQDQNPTAEFNSDGIYTVNLSVISTFGCESTITRDIELLPSPEVSFSYSDVCLGEEVRFTDESIPPPGESITEWAWDLGGEFSSDRNPVKSFDFPVEYDVSLTVQASNQCIGSEEKTLLVPAIPEIDFSIQNNCIGTSTLFRDLSIPGNDPVTGRIWDFGGLGIATGEEVSFEFPRTGEFLVSLTLETQNGCTYTESRQITVIDPPVAEFTAEPLAGAPPLEVDFINLSRGAETYAWYVNEQLVSTEENISYTFNELASYDVRLEVFNDQGCSDQFIKIINAVEPETDLRADELVPVRLNGRIEFQFKATNLGNVPVDQIPVRLILNDRVELTDIVEASLQAGQTSSFRLPFKVEDSSFDFVCAEIEQTIQGFPDKDLTNNSACFIFSEQPGISAPYPNPAADALFFNIYTDGPGEFETEVINNFGQAVVAPTVIVERTGKYMIKIDLSGLSQGHYLLKVNTGGSFETFQFVIDR